MALDRDTVAEVAHLARLRWDPERTSNITEDLARIVAMIDQIEQVDTTDTPPLAHPLELSQPLRADEVVASPSREGLQASAPEIAEGMYQVPKMFE